MGIYRLAVVGESFVNDDGTARQVEIKRCRVGEPVKLLREPDNPHDPGAVAVLSMRGVQIGNLSREAGWVAAAIDAGRPFKAQIEAINGRPNELSGVVLWCASDADAVPPPIVQATPSPQASRRHEAMAAAALKDKPRDNGCLLFLAIMGTLLTLAMCNRSSDVDAPPPTPAQTAATSAVRESRLAECQRIINDLVRSGGATITARERIEVDDADWAQIPATQKRAIAAGFACTVFGGRQLNELETMDYVVVYGRISGHRLAQAGSTGVNLE